MASIDRRGNRLNPVGLPFNQTLPVPGFAIAWHSYFRVPPKSYFRALGAVQPHHADHSKSFNFHECQGHKRDPVASVTFEQHFGVQRFIPPRGKFDAPEILLIIETLHAAFTTLTPV